MSRYWNIVQMRTMPGSTKAEKVENSLSLIERASREGCQIILHGELATTDYEKFYTKDPEYFALAEPIPGPTTDAVGELTRRHGNYVIIGLFEGKISKKYCPAAKKMARIGVRSPENKQGYVDFETMLGKAYGAAVSGNDRAHDEKA